MDDLQMAEIVYTVATEFPDLIPKMDWLKGHINHDFKVTFQNQLINILIFTFGYSVNIFYLIFTTTDSLKKKSNLKYAIGTSIYFFLIELGQMIYLKSKYFKNPWNFL
jgi:hypothetical protein